MRDDKFRLSEFGVERILSNLKPQASVAIGSQTILGPILGSSKLGNGEIKILLSNTETGSKDDK